MGRIGKKGIASGTSGSGDFSLENSIAPSMNNASDKIPMNEKCYTLNINNETSKLNVNKQNKHIEGSKEYEIGKSIITVSLKKCQEIINKFKGTGRINSDNNETVDTGEVVGYYVNKSTNEKMQTTYVTIRYSKTGAHIVPAMPKKKEK